MVKLKIASGDPVEISQKDQEGEPKSYVSMVEDYDNKNTVLIHTPISSGVYIRLAQNQQYLLSFTNKKGVFRFHALMNEYKTEGNLQFLEFNLLGNGKRIQHRDFFRLPCTIPLSFSRMSVDEKGELTQGEIFDGIIRDLSGGGMKIVSKFDISENDVIKFNLQLNGDEYELMGEIRYKSRIPIDIQTYMSGIMFMGLSEAERKKIVLYLHNLQLKSLRTGLTDFI